MKTPGVNFRLDFLHCFRQVFNRLRDFNNWYTFSCYRHSKLSGTPRVVCKLVQRVTSRPFDRFLFNYCMVNDIAIGKLKKSSEIPFSVKVRLLLGTGFQPTFRYPESGADINIAIWSKPDFNCS